MYRKHLKLSISFCLPYNRMRHANMSYLPDFSVLLSVLLCFPMLTVVDWWCCLVNQEAHD
jgi:hypothetical protein